MRRRCRGSETRGRWAQQGDERKNAWNAPNFALEVTGPAIYGHLIHSQSGCCGCRSMCDASGTFAGRMRIIIMYTQYEHQQCLVVGLSPGSAPVRPCGCTCQECPLDLGTHNCHSSGALPSAQTVHMPGHLANAGCTRDSYSTVW